MRVFRKRLTYANVAATAAVLLAMSGTSYALVVTGSQIKNGSVGERDLMAGSVGSAEVIDASLKLKDLATDIKSAHKEKGFILRSDVEVGIGRGLAEQARVATLNLPPGKYVVNGSFKFQSGLDANSCPPDQCPGYIASHDIICEIGDPNQGQNDPVFERYDFELPSHKHWQVVVPMTFVGGVDGDGLAVNCWRSEEAALLAHPASLGYVVSAIEVDTIAAP